MPDVIKDDDYIVARLEVEVAAELVLDLQDSDGMSVSGDSSEDSSSDEELRWFSAPKKASSCVQTFSISS
jgi:hypothetical protein